PGCWGPWFIHVSVSGGPIEGVSVGMLVQRDIIGDIELGEPVIMPVAALHPEHKPASFGYLDIEAAIIIDLDDRKGLFAHVPLSSWDVPPGWVSPFSYACPCFSDEQRPCSSDPPIRSLSLHGFAGDGGRVCGGEYELRLVSIWTALLFRRLVLP